MAPRNRRFRGGSISAFPVPKRDRACPMAPRIGSIKRRALFMPCKVVHLADEMIDVEIIYPGEKQAMAFRLRDALVEAGYQVDAKAGFDFLEMQEEAKALVIIWDRSSIRLPAMQ